ncbi:hypothetical protein [Saccharopolyspora spinosa]|uniref:hypothetical protein n=1 Tax=Saccharopolyspora spinosa TaxID=60894 RepID=UPI0011D2B567|nr:hypothetical protein [Saccharopolyspora spinosa]
MPRAAGGGKPRSHKSRLWTPGEINDRGIPSDADTESIKSRTSPGLAMCHLAGSARLLVTA